jgi:UDP-N-acetyl-D-mannosaminuronate dehydrogenase
MIKNQKIVVVGLGEVGKPLFDLAKMHYEDVIGVDLSPVDGLDHVDVLHICIPYEIPDFVGETARYMDLFNPAVTVINSTVGIGTTRTIAERTGRVVVNSPIRGKHARMLQEIQMYTKFVGAITAEAAESVAAHFGAMGMKTRILSSPEATELAKLTETTYFGVLIAWAQDIERYCDQAGTNYDEICSIFEEIGYLPKVKFWPGVIGGHCVMPNIEILSAFKRSDLLDAIRNSNDLKMERESSRNLAVTAQ